MRRQQFAGKMIVGLGLPVSKPIFRTQTCLSSISGRTTRPICIHMSTEAVRPQRDNPRQGRHPFRPLQLHHPLPSDKYGGAGSQQPDARTPDAPAPRLWHLEGRQGPWSERSLGGVQRIIDGTHSQRPQSSRKHDPRRGGSSTSQSARPTRLLTLQKVMSRDVV